MQDEHWYGSRRSHTRLALEPRLLFDGAAAATLVATADATHAEPVPQPHDAADTAPAANDMHAFDSHPPAPEGPAEAVSVQPPQGATFVFVSGDLADLNTLLAALPAQSQVVLLDPQRDGLQQIEAALGDRHDIASIHLVTHGGEGSLQIGSTALDGNAMTGIQRDALAAIGAHLVDGGDVLVYGCDFAAGTTGHAALESLALALRADVAASDDATGSATRGGNWTLEQHAGAVFTHALAAEQWDGLLLNTPPVAVADTATVAEDASVVINVLANDTDLQGDALTVTSASALHGGVVINANGTITYTPTANYNGADTITYTIRDSQGANALAPGTVAVTITPVDDMPTVNAISVPVFAEDTPLVFASINGTLLSLGDIDGGISRVTLTVPIGDLTLSQTAGLTFVQGDGSHDSTMTFQGSIANLNAALDGLVYTPGADYNGNVNLTVGIRDTLLSLPLVTTTIPLGISAVADIVADTVTTPMNTAASFNVLANDTFENAGRVVSGYTTPSHGTVTLTAQGAAVYTPTAGYAGADSFTYTVTSNGTTETTTVSITALAPNNAPTLGVPAAQSGSEDTALVFSTGNGNALSVADADGDTLTVTLASTHGAMTLSRTTGLTFLSGDGTADASMVFSGSAANINAALQGAAFAPTADYNGAAVLSLQVSDGQASQSASVALTLAAVADGVADVLTTPVLTPVTFYPLANDSFEGPASVVAVGAAAHGTVVLGLLGAVTYTPNLNYHGSDAFTYTVSAGGVTEVVSVSVTVGTNQAPVTTGPGSLAIADGQLVVVNAGVSFSDPNIGDVLTFSASGLPAGLTIDASTGVITGTVGGHASQVAGGTYAVLITATDPSGASVTGTLTVTVTNPGPIVTASAVNGQEDTNLNLSVLVNASDPDGDALSVTGATALHGSVVVHPDGSLTYSPFANYNGLDTITYTVQDADGASATGSVLVTLAAVVDLPTITLPTINVFNEDTPLIFGSLMGQQISVGDVDGAILDIRLSVPIGTLTLAQTAGVSISEGHGTNDSAVRLSGTAAAINAAINGLIYTPGADYNGPLTLSIELGQLGQLLSVYGTVPLGIAAVVDIADDNVTLLRNQSASFNVLANDTFENSGRVVSSFTTPTHGTLTLDAQGNGVYTPANGYTGSDSFTYTVTSNGTTETATVTLGIAVPPNTAPTSTALPGVARLDSQTIGIDTAGHFSDADGDALAYSASGLPAGLSIDAATGRITGTLGSSASQGGSGGAYTVVVTANDGHGGTTSQAFTLTATNPGPSAVNDTASVAEDGSLNGNVLGNDSDVDGDALHVATTPVAAPAHGVLNLHADGSYVYVPDANYFGADSFSYRLIDADGASSTATVSITVTPVNDAPTSSPLTPRSANDGTAVSITTASNFSDVDGDALNYSASGLPAGLSINAVTGVITGTLGSSASQAITGGVYTVVVTAADPSGASTSQSFALTIGNPAPTAVNDTATVNEDTSLTGNVLGNDSDVDGDALHVATAPVAAPAHGVLTLRADGSYTYTPAGNYNGSDSFSYRLIDADGASSIATVSITVVAVNDAPVSTTLGSQAANDGAAVSIATASNFSDVDGDALTYSASGLPTGLSINAVTGVITGTLGSSASQAIAGGVYTVVVTAADPSGASTSQSFALTVANPAPTAVNDTATVNEDTSLTGNVLGNDSDVDGDALHVATTPVTGPSHGTLTLATDGSYTYTPAPNFNGSDSFTYRLIDADGASSIATVVITVVAVNDAPTSSGFTPRSANDGAAVSIATASNFGDVDGDALTYSVSGLPAGLTIDTATGLISGTLGSSASHAVPGGVYTVVVTAADPSGSTTSQGFTLTVGNPAPTAVNDTATVNEDTPLTGNVLANDSDADGDAITVDTTPVTGPAHGTLTLAADGTYTYTPAPNFNGSDSFQYRLVDADGASSIATVSITVVAVNDVPVSTTLGSQAANDGAAVSIATASNFSDVDGDALTYSVSGLPAGLTIDAATGLITGTLGSSASQAVPGGVYTVVVTAADPSGAATSQSFALTVGNPAPTALNDSATVNEDTSLTGNVLANDSDVDGDPITVDTTPVTGPSHGTLTLATDGSYTYTPAANFNGPDSFSYRLIDADGASSIATVTITVVAVNDAPVSTTLGSQAANDGAAVSITTASNFSDVDGDALNYSASGLPAGLTIDTATGLISGTLGSSASQAVPGGVYTVVVTAADPSGATTSQSFALTVGNPAPTALNDSATVNEDTSLTGNVLANDSDVDGDPITVDTTPVTGPSHGTLTLATDGSYTYTPAANFNGPDSFSYRLIDADGASSIATVSITVVAVNDAPVSTTLGSQAANDGAAVSIATASNFSDVDGDALTYSVSGLPTGLTIDAATGLITGTLSSSASQAVPGGVYTVVVTAADPSGSTTSQGFTLTVANPAPTALNDSATVNEDGSVSGNVRTNDSDADGDAITVDTTPVTGPAHGTLTLATDGSYTYTPAANFNGSDSFQYRLIDTDGASSIATVSITVVAVNDAPVSTTLGSQAANDGAAVSIATASNFGDVDGDALTYSVSGLPAGLTIDAATGLITGTLGSSASHAVPGGVYTIFVTALDASGASTSQSFTLTASNTTPIAANDAGIVNEDAALTGNVLANDSDADGDALIVDTTPVTGPSHGTLVLAADGSYTYTPAANYNGSDSFSYRVTDADGASAIASVSITVVPVNDAPVSTPLADRSNTLGTPVSLNAGAVFGDVDGDTLSFQATGLPPGLAIDAATGVISGTPLVVGNYAVTVTATDPGGASSSQGFVWTATLVGNNAPNTVGTIGDRTLADATAVAIATAGRFVDPDGDALVYSATGLPAGLAIDAATGQITGTLASGASSAIAGGAYAIVVSANDGHGGSASQSFVLTAQNPAPTATNDTIAVNEDGSASGNLLANDSDPDGDALHIETTPVVGPAHGTLVLNADGSYSYTPDADYAGTDSFSYRLVDADGGTSVASVAVTVAAVNDAPDSTALADFASTDGAAVLIDTGGHFSDRDGDTLAFGAIGLPAGLAIDTVTGRIGGVLASNASSAVPGGAYTIVVTADDGHGGSVSRSFTLTAANLAPSAVADSATVSEDTPFAGNVRSNDSDPDGDAIVVDTTPVTAPAHGTLVLLADGSYTYTPAANYAGADSFSYRLIDADGASAVATVTITVLAVNDAPTAAPIAAQTAADGAAVGIATAASFQDAEGDTLAFSATGLPTGLAIDPATGLIGGTLAGNASSAVAGGVYTVTVTADDGHGGTVSRSFMLTAQNPAPVAVDDAVAVNEDGSVGGNLLANDSDPDGDALTLDTTPVVGPAHGTLVLAADGSFRYTPEANYAGSDSFSYRVVDADGGMAIATVGITVAAVNDAPTAAALPGLSLVEATPVAIDTAAAFADVDGDALAFSATGLPAGLAIDAATGRITGTLDGHASQAVAGGVYTVVVTADDGHGGSVSSTLVLTAVNPAPTAIADAASVAEDGSVSGDLLANASDPDGDALAVATTPVAAPAHGRVVIGTDGRYTYTPDAGYAGPDAFSYRLVDADGGSVVATVALTVTAINHAPSAVDDQVSVDEDNILTGNVLANDTDRDGDALHVALEPVTPPAHGSVVLTADGGYTYTPDPDFAGTDSFRYRLVDANGAASIGTVSVTVVAVNDAPRATPLPSVTTALGTPVTILAGAGFSDVEGQAMTFSATGLPAGVTIDPATGTIHGTPVRGGGFDVIVTATDSGGAQTPVSMRIDVAETAAGPAPISVSPSDNRETPLDTLANRTYAPLLLDAVNAVKSLQGLGNLNDALPLNAAIAASGGFGSGTELRLDQAVIGQVVGDMNNAARAPVNLAALAPSGLDASGFGSRANNQSAAAASGFLSDGAAPAPTPAVLPPDPSAALGGDTRADRPIDTLNTEPVLPKTLSGQLKAASLGQFAEIDALAAALSTA